MAGGLTYIPTPNPHDDSLDSVEVYDPSAASWYSVGKLNVARRYHTAALNPDGTVLVIGGVAHDLYSGGFLKLKSTELYEPAALVWTLAGDLRTGRNGHTQTVLHTPPVIEVLRPFGVLVAGGDDALSYLHSLSGSELYSSSAEQPPVSS